ncbi:sunset domain-containing protein [Kribbella deserti]|uniref:Uncharacterized protein n=1 Tax=Kribbella deserti TaxID=1926257 RepID=A0ABV6QK85_9ACTN
MRWLFRRDWWWQAIVFLLGAVLGWLLLNRRRPAIGSTTPPVEVETLPVPEKTPEAGSIETPVDGSAPDGYPIKGSTQSKLFHTAESPYYSRIKAAVWFRTEADAVAAGFTKYERRRKK